MGAGKSKTLAIFPGTFDPLTRGHEDLVQRSCRLFGTTIIAVANSSPKKTLFSLAERISMIRNAVQGLKGARVESFDGLLVNYAQKVGAQVIVRGLRAVSDFEYEFQMALMNRSMAPNIEITYLMPKQDYVHLSSSLIKEVAQFGGKLNPSVNPDVARKLKSRFSTQNRKQG